MVERIVRVETPCDVSLELLAHVLRNSNAVMPLTGLVLAELSQDEQTARRFSTVLAEFADCVPAMKPFPDD